ncbi:tuftelin 1b isoform X4 [Thunnus thynnus]|uniref:tuftelin 1b isoform X4 n=1 Tax=Thunnus thynnus TaxID=8237 RepID=UPI003528346B
MSGGVTRTLKNGEEENNRSNERCRWLRLTRQDQDQSGTSERHSSKESSIAVVLPQKPEKQEETPELITPTDEKVEVIKVRYCLKSLREQMAARQSSNNNKVGDNQEESVRLREATKRLYAQLKEMEKRHQEEQERLQVESNEYHVRLAEQSERLKKAEKQSEERGQKVEELQRLLGSMEIESSILKDKMASGEAELLQLKAGRQEEGKEQRCAELEKDLAIQKEKIHHLDDMLKSQQRKVRHMIEQLQNSRTVIQERDRVIRDLEEKVAFLEAENREMHDHMEYFLGGQDSLDLTPSENKQEVVYSKPLTPTTPTNKALPFIKVIEIKS